MFINRWLPLAMLLSIHLSYEANGQILNVKFKDGTNFLHELSQIRKLTHTATDLIITDKDNNMMSWKIASIENITHDLITKAEPIIVAELSIELHPNPTTDFLNITYKSSKSENLVITVTDLQGQIIERFEEIKISEIYSKGIDIRDYTPGLYLVKITTPDRSVSKKFLTL